MVLAVVVLAVICAVLIGWFGCALWVVTRRPQTNLSRSQQQFIMTLVVMTSSGSLEAALKLAAKENVTLAHLRAAAIPEELARSHQRLMAAYL